MLDATLLDNFDAAGAVAHGLPGVAYTSDSFMQLEREQLFANHWVFVGYAHKLPKAGDAKPIQVGGLPLFLLRDQQGRIVAFHNVCRHRNLKLIDATGNCGKLIRCPYHSWSYDLCGVLRNAPYFGGHKAVRPPEFRYEENGLVPVSCEVWHDWIFVNLSPQPMVFDDFLAPIRRQLGRNEVTDYVPVATIDLGEVPCNWKLLMENFIEPYHVQFVHKSTTAQPLEDHYTVIDEHCLGSAVELSAEQVASAREGTLGVTSHYLTLFPNFVMGTYQPDQMGVHLNEPIAAALTRQQRVIYAHKDARYSDAKIQQLSELWRSVHLEDHAMCIRLQQGRYSPLATQGGLLSPHWENSVRKFQERVADAIRPALI
ncbi:MAG TPA: aromatic ring-hydroxylating dioxygenase subunit alpha [Gammaproteobacteria bacterium]|nr:aromatic ring-hydroxylating dioxygenase subunit alpha [Gammaproteobacteria bacterium]